MYRDVVQPLTNVLMKFFMAVFVIWDLHMSSIFLLRLYHGYVS